MGSDGWGGREGRGGVVEERGGDWRVAVDNWRSGGAGWGMRTGTHDFGESVE